MKQYTLYLDESETHIHNHTTNRGEQYHFCMAGVIIAVDDYADLEESVRNLKRNIWSERDNPEEIILHQMLINEAEKGRLDAAKHPEYVKFSKKQERKKFYNELKKVFQKNDLTIVGTSINKDDFKKYYFVNNRNKQDEYLVAMQLLLENFCHFLCANNAIGNIIYEYRELKGNERLRDRYYHMKLMGSMYMNKITYEKRLLGLDFINKNENCAGLQVADFVPLSFARDHLGAEQSDPNIFGTLKHYRYDGKIGVPERFGVKYVP